MCHTESKLWLMNRVEITQTSVTYGNIDNDTLALVKPRFFNEPLVLELLEKSFHSSKQPTTHNYFITDHFFFLYRTSNKLYLFFKNVKIK